jgi:YD repeat-containing protein
MKKIALIAISIVFFSTSCKKNEDPAANVSRCKITEIAATGQGDMTSVDPYSFTETKKFEYNDQNLLSGISYLRSGKTASNKTFTYGYSYSYQYDANGYLIRQAYQSSNVDASGSSSYSASTSYEYAANRLIKQTNNSSSVDAKGVTITGTTISSYEYTTDGKISKNSYSYLGSDGTVDSYFTTYEYNIGILSRYSVNRAGVITSPFIEVNSQGLITKEIDKYETRYQYDAEGNLTRWELWSNGAKTNIEIYEYDTKQNVTLLSYPQFKGREVFPFYGKSDFGTHNITKDSRLTVEAGIEKPSSTYSFTFQYNSNNLPTSSATTYAGADGKIFQQSNVSYTYKDCQ